MNARKGNWFYVPLYKGLLSGPAESIKIKPYQILHCEFLPLETSAEHFQILQAAEESLKGLDFFKTISEARSQYVAG